MKFVAFFKNIALLSLVIMTTFDGIKNVKFDKSEFIKANISIPLTQKSNNFETEILKNVDFITISDTKKFSISKKEFKVKIFKYKFRFFHPIPFLV